MPQLSLKPETDAGLFRLLVLFLDDLGGALGAAEPGLQAGEGGMRILTARCRAAMVSAWRRLARSGAVTRAASLAILSAEMPFLARMGVGSG